MLASLTIENYVKAIYQICASQEEKNAATGQIAEALEVAPGTVTSMLKTLNDSKLAEYAPYEGVKLTETGTTLALRVLRRHRLFELFLVKTLSLSWDEVHEEAENMEHAVSEFLVDRMDEYLEFPEFDPHGDPIPKADGSVSPMSSVTLSDLKSGENFQLVRVLDQSPKFLRYLSERDVRLGINGTVIENSSEAGIVTIRIESNETSLARETAKKLVVTSAVEVAAAPTEFGSENV